MKLTKANKKTTALVAIVLVLVCILSFGAIAGFFTKTEVITQQVTRYITPEEHLFVETTYLLKTDEANHTVNVTCTPYITNTWLEDSGEIKLIIYVIDRKNIAEYKNTIEVGKIKGNTTLEIELPIILTKNTTRVDILVFENEKLQLKGNSRLTANQQFKYTPEGHVRGYSWTLENDGFDFYQVQH